MYNIFKKIMIASLMMVAIVSCDNEDYLVFTAVNEKEVKFQNEFLPVYKLSSATSSNVAERLVWNEPDFGAPATITYVVEISTSSNFGSIAMSSGDLSSNHMALSVKDLLGIAETLGLDEEFLGEGGFSSGLGGLELCGWLDSRDVTNLRRAIQKGKWTVNPSEPLDGGVADAFRHLTIILRGAEKRKCGILMRRHS